MNLKDRFFHLFLAYSSDKNLIETYWSELERAYSQKFRHYHNLTHLEELFEHFEVFKNRLENADLVAISIFYHDVVYSIFRKDNEEKSAVLAEIRLKELGFSMKEILQLKKLILATKNHEPFDIDSAFLSDSDLAILGTNNDDYLNYTKKIRKEYSKIPSFLYKNGRKKVLKHFLEKEFIYKTDEFRDSKEKIARVNLKYELEQLNS